MVLTVALAMTANIVVGHNMARMEQSRRLQFLGASYAEALIKPLWDCDDTAAQAIMNSMLQSRAISGGRLQNACTNQWGRNSTSLKKAWTSKQILVYRSVLG